MKKKCAFTFCEDEVGLGTRIDITVNEERVNPEVCELHWLAMREVTFAKIRKTREGSS